MSLPSPGAPKRIFLSYCHKDRRWLMLMKPHLLAARDFFRLTIWDDTAIEVAVRWEDAIFEAISQADSALLLVSPDFLASTFIMTEELPRVFRRFHGLPGRTLPVFIRYSLVDSVTVRYTTEQGEAAVRLIDLQGYIAPSKPLSKLSAADRDLALVELTRRVAGLSTADGASSDSRLAAQLRASEQRRALAAADEAAGRKTRVVLEIDDAIETWTADRESRLIARLARALEIEPAQIIVERRSRGSVLLDVLMPPWAAFEVAELTDLGVFKGAGLVRADLLPLNEAGGASPVGASAGSAAAGPARGDESHSADPAWAYPRTTTAALLEDAALDAVGCLDPEESAAFETSLRAAPASVQALVRNEQSRFAVIDALLPRVSVPESMRERVLAAVRRDMAMGLGEEKLRANKVPMISARRVSPLWRTASVGLAAAAIVLGITTIQALSSYRPTDGFAERADLFFAQDADYVQLKAVASSSLEARLFRRGKRATLAVRGFDKTTVPFVEIVFVSSGGSASSLGRMDRDTVPGVRLIDLRASVVAQLASGRLEVRDPDGQIILQT